MIPQNLSDKTELNDAIPEINLGMCQEELAVLGTRDGEIRTGYSSTLEAQKNQSQVLEAVGEESIEEARREITPVKTQQKERPQHISEELGDHAVSVTRASEGKWDFKKKTDLSFTALSTSAQYRKDTFEFGKG
jgi:hypothetical protein